MRGGSLARAGSSDISQSPSSVRNEHRQDVLAKSCHTQDDSFDEQWPGMWGQWCRDNFRTENNLMRAFGVSERTARHWLNNEYPPRGKFVARAAIVFNFPNGARL